MCFAYDIILVNGVKEVTIFQSGRVERIIEIRRYTISRMKIYAL